MLVFHDGASDAEYAALLDAATALVTASLDEGSGCPLVEAMQLGMPVVVTDIPIFREIGGTAALYSPAGDAEALAAPHPAPRGAGESGAALGGSRREAARYSWDASAGACSGAHRDRRAQRARARAGRSDAS